VTGAGPLKDTRKHRQNFGFTSVIRHRSQLEAMNPSTGSVQTSEPTMWDGKSAQGRVTLAYSVPRTANITYYYYLVALSSATAVGWLAGCWPQKLPRGKSQWVEAALLSLFSHLFSLAVMPTTHWHEPKQTKHIMCSCQQGLSMDCLFSGVLHHSIPCRFLH